MRKRAWANTLSPPIALTLSAGLQALSLDQGPQAVPPPGGSRHPLRHDPPARLFLRARRGYHPLNTVFILPHMAPTVLPTLGNV